MVQYYANAEVEVDSERFEDRLIENVTVRKPMPEFLAGIEPPLLTDITLSNIDKSLTDLRATTQFRGKFVDIREAFYATDTLDTPLELNAIYTGIVDSSIVDHSTVNLNATTQGLDILDAPFPTRKVTTDILPDAIDLDVAINEVFGKAYKVPLPLIYVEDTPSIQYDYLVGRGDLTVDVVYRENLVITAFTGTAQSATATTISLAASTNENDDFFNETYVEITGGTGVGQVKRITDYNGSTDTATVESAWATNPDNTSTYAIREWGKFLQTIDGETHTIIRFAITQRQRGSNTLYQRESMSADVTGLSTETNPAEAVSTILTAIGATVNSTSVSDAVTAISTIGDLTVGGAMTVEKDAREWLEELCLIGRIHLSLNASNEYIMTIIGSQDTITGLYDDSKNIVDLSTPSEESTFSLWKNFQISYRPQLNSGEFRLKTEKKNVFPTEGKVEEVREFTLIDNKTTADKVADFIAKVKEGTDRKRTISLANEARKIQNLDLITITAPSLNYDSDVFLVIGTEIGSGVYTAEVIAELTTINSYTPGTLPSDPATDGQADYRFTPARPVTSLGVSWSITTFNVAASAALSWTNPTVNYIGAVVEYKLSADSLWETFTTTDSLATQSTITGLTPGQNYDFRVTSLNISGDLGIPATITSSTAPGDTTAPNAPTSLVFDGPMFGQLNWTFSASSSTDVQYYEYQIDDASTFSTPIYTGQTADNKLEWHGEDSGGLASGVTRWARVRAVDFSGLTSGWLPSSGGVSGTTEGVSSGDIGNDQINSQHYVNLSIDNAHIALLAVDTAQIASLAVEEAKIGSLAVDTAKIQSLAVETLKIGDDDVTSFKHQILATATHNNIQPGTLNADTVYRSAVKTTTHSEDGPLCMSWTASDNFSTIGNPSADTKVTLATWMVTNSSTQVATVVTMGCHANSQNFTGLDADLSYYFW